MAQRKRTKKRTKKSTKRTPPRWRKHHDILYKPMRSPRRAVPGRRSDQAGAEAKLEEKRGKKEGVEYRKDWESWGRRVRRDILVIEAFLKAKFPDFDSYEDPGDPPPPPDEEFIP